MAVVLFIRLLLSSGRGIGYDLNQAVRLCLGGSWGSRRSKSLLFCPPIPHNPSQDLEAKLACGAASCTKLRADAISDTTLGFEFPTLFQRKSVHLESFGALSSLMAAPHGQPSQPLLGTLPGKYLWSSRLSPAEVESLYYQGG